MLATAKPGVDLPEGERLALSKLVCLAPFQGTLKLPAGFFIPQNLGALLQQDLAGNLDHGPQIFKSPQRDPSISVIHETCGSGAIFGGTVTVPSDTFWVRLARFRLHPAFNPDFMTPRDVQVVLVDEPRTFAKPESRQCYLGRVGTKIG